MLIFQTLYFINMIICIVGLPCSGKTYLSKSVGKYFNLPIIDDPILISFIPKNCVISSPFFCINFVRDYLTTIENKRNNKIIFWYFENNFEQCVLNTVTRPSRNVTGLIKNLASTYIPPYVNFPVWSSYEPKKYLSIYPSTNFRYEQC